MCVAVGEWVRLVAWTTVTEVVRSGKKVLYDVLTRVPKVYTRDIFVSTDLAMISYLVFYRAGPERRWRVNIGLVENA